MPEGTGSEKPVHAYYALRSSQRLLRTPPPVFDMLPAGPMALGELFWWPCRLWGSFSLGDKSRFLNNARKLSVRTQYSGMGCVEQAWHAMALSLSFVGVHASTPVFLEQCDISPLCRQVLLSLPEPCKARHDYGDLLQRVPWNIRQELLDSHWPSRPKRKRQGMQYSAALSLYNRLMQDALDSARDILRKGRWQWLDVCNKLQCFRHRKLCVIEGDDDDESMENTYSMVVVGSSCVDWSTWGSGQGCPGQRISPS